MQKLALLWKHKVLNLMIAVPLVLSVTTFAAGIYSLQAYSDRNVAAAIPPSATLKSTNFKNWGISNKISDSHIHALEAWKLERGNKDIVVAVVDTGIDPQHPDLKNNLWHDPVSGVYGWDFVTNQPNPKDDHGHGTHVAGIIGAALNKKAGIAGVAPNVSIMAVKYYSAKNTGAQNLKNSIKALNWAINHGAKIINYSGGGPEYSTEEFKAIERARSKGILIVAAAGNERSNTDDVDSFYYPCAYNLDNIVCVAATNIRNDMLKSSNWGKVRVDAAAPGENILSTAPGGKYAYMSGTSQATAFVSGISALLLAKNHSLKPWSVRDIIRRSVDKLPQLKNKVRSGGKVNAARALAEVVRGLKDKIRSDSKSKAAVAKKPTQPVLSSTLGDRLSAVQKRAKQSPLLKSDKHKTPAAL